MKGYEKYPTSSKSANTSSTTSNMSKSGYLSGAIVPFQHRPHLLPWTKILLAQSSPQQLMETIPASKRQAPPTLSTISHPTMPV
jgi:hypothetical protein